MDSGGLVNRVLLAPFGLPMEPKNYSHDEKIRIIPEGLNVIDYVYYFYSTQH